MKYLKYKVFILLFLYSHLFSSEHKYLQKAQDLNLSQNQYWYNLLYYNKEHSKSLIIYNNDFFLSKNGHIQSSKELNQTIKLFVSQPNSICRFPARYKWLNSKLELNIKKQKCSELEEFLKPNYKKIDVIFTSERYNSPASVFGHTFLKLTSDTIPYAIDYSARIPDNDKSFTYIYKGLTGKYKSHYKLTTYANKEYDYRSKEFRDLLTFELKLTKDEITNIMLYLFEIEYTYQDYYFLGRNCSSELIKLLDMSRYDLNMKSELKDITVPIDVVYILKKYNLIKQISNQTSKLKEFNLLTNQLSKDEQNILSNIINHKISIYEFDKDTTLSKKNKEIIILASIMYIEIQSTIGKLDDKYIYPLLKLIKLKSKYKIISQYDNKQIVDKNPISNKFNKLSFAIKQTTQQSKQLLIGYRPLYRHRFDLLDNIIKHGSVELFDISFINDRNKISLNYLTLVNLEAMPISNNFFTETTNKIKIGATRLFSNENLYSYINYGLGYRNYINDSFNYNSFINTGIYYLNTDLYSVSIEQSLEYNYYNKIILELGYILGKYSNSIESKKLYLNNYIKLTKDTTLNISLSKVEDIKKYNNIIIKYNISF